VVDSCWDMYAPAILVFDDDADVSMLLRCRCGVILELLHDLLRLARAIQKQMRYGERFCEIHRYLVDT